MQFQKSTLLAIGMLAVMCASAGAQTTKPDAAVTRGELQLRANEAMAKNDFAAALPMLEKVAQELTEQPDDLGPVMEEIRVCKRQIQMAKNPPKLAIVSIEPRQGRKPHSAVEKGQTLDIAIKALGNFDYDQEKGGNIPEDVMKLDGCHIRTSGFMISLDQAENISEFALVPSITQCCIGLPPQIQHTIIVHCPKGKSLAYFADELVVEGTLHVREQKDDGFIISIFEIDTDSVKPAQQ